MLTAAATAWVWGPKDTCCCPEGLGKGCVCSRHRPSRRGETKKVGRRGLETCSYFSPNLQKELIGDPFSELQGTGGSIFLNVF